MSSHAEVIAVINAQLNAAIAATKCHGCGCLAFNLNAMGEATRIAPELMPILDAARGVLVPQKYECMGCDTCYPAVAANALQEAYPDAISQAALCPTEAPEERTGWPPLPGDYSVIRYGGSVAVCALNSAELVRELTRLAPPGLAIAGTMHTENLGIERVISNATSNPNIRFMVLCGEDTRQLVGHLPGQCMECLFVNGIDEEQRIVGAKGKRPFLKNVSAGQAAAFREQVRLVSMIGETSVQAVAAAVERCHAEGLPPYEGLAVANGIETVRAPEPQFFKSDPAGFLVVYPDKRAKQLVVEHYTNAGVLDCIVSGTTPVAIYFEIIKRKLVTQLDHAAYLGRELAAAERTLRTGEAYVQDRAPGEALPAIAPTTASKCGPSCTTCD